MTHDPNIRCEMWCTEPIGPDGEPPDSDWKACCPSCDKKRHWLSHEVLPQIRKNGYYCPPDADENDELHAMVDQVNLRPAMDALLESIVGDAHVVHLPPEVDE